MSKPGSSPRAASVQVKRGHWGLAGGLRGRDHLRKTFDAQSLLGLCDFRGERRIPLARSIEAGTMT